MRSLRYTQTAFDGGTFTDLLIRYFLYTVFPKFDVVAKNCEFVHVLLV